VRQARARQAYSRIPDYHTVFPPGHPQHRADWSDLCRPVDPFSEPTRLLPTYDGRLMTRGAQWRSGG
jgi:hypothetical protein